jgi:hypothetical protein
VSVDVDVSATHCHPESLLRCKHAPWLLQQAELAAPCVELHCTSAEQRARLFLKLPAVLQQRIMGHVHGPKERTVASCANSQLRDAALAATHSIRAHVHSATHLAAFGDRLIKHGQHLSSLELSYQGIDCAVNAALLCRQLPNLTYLSISGPAVDDSTAQVLGTLVGLRYLDLDGVRMTLGGLSALAQLTCLNVLRMTRRRHDCIQSAAYALEHVFNGRDTFMIYCTVRAVHTSQPLQRCT